MKPDVVALGNLATVSSSLGGTQQGNGTSFSSPIMCGAIACLWQANPHMSNMQVINAVQRSGHQYYFPDTLLGYGIPNLAVAHLILGGYDFSVHQSKGPVKLMPNPFSNLLMLTFNSMDSQVVDFSLFNIQGEMIFRKSFTKNIGYNAICLDELDHLAAGVYVLRFSDNGKYFTEKVVKR